MLLPDTTGGIKVLPTLGCRAVKVVKVLGEGGFSFVYLVQDEHSGVRDVLAAVAWIELT